MRRVDWRHRLGHVAPGGGHGPDHGNRAALACQGGDQPRPFIERGQTGRQIRGITFFGGHLFQPGRDFPQGFGPAAGGVGHQGHRMALVAKILRQGHPHIDAGLPGRHRHVGGVGDQHGALHQRVAGPGVDQLRKLHEHVGHFIAPFPAAHVNHDIGVGPLGQGLLRHRFAGAERSGNRGVAAHGHGKQHVQYPHAGEERRVRVQLFLNRAGAPHRPDLEHGEFGAVFERHHRFCYGIGAGRFDLLDDPADVRGHHDLVR